jgi:hypothetical protein
MLLIVSITLSIPTSFILACNNLNLLLFDLIVMSLDSFKLFQASTIGNKFLLHNISLDILYISISSSLSSSIALLCVTVTLLVTLHGKSFCFFL